MPQSQSQPARRIDEIIVHCSATPNGAWRTVEDIDAMHAQRGFVRDPRVIGHNQPALKSIGYHYVIYTTGAVVIGRGENEIGAHCKGRNARSIGVCLIGTDRYSVEQWAALSQLVVGLQARFDGARVLGHRDCSPDADGDGTVEPREWLKTCPGFDVAAWLARGMMPAIDSRIPLPASRTEVKP